jgi:hypothetical protein
MSHRTLVWLGFLVVTAALGLVGFKSLCPTARSPDGAAGAEEEPPLVLDGEQKEYLWQIEHHGNVLSRHGFKALAAALEKADGAALDRLLAPDFTGQAPPPEGGVGLHTDVLDVVRHGPDLAPVTLGRTPFVDRLLELRRVFGPAVKAKLALMGLAPATWGDLEGPWQGTGQLRLWGEWEKGKPAEVIAYLRYRVRRPTAAGLDAGGWLSACTITQCQVGKAQRFLLRESAAARGIDPRQFYDNWAHDTAVTMTGGVYACDFNRDGILDLLITDLTGYYLYQGGPGGTFANVTTAMGLPAELDARTHTGFLAAFADLDGDGWVDLILGDQVYRNDHGRRFEDVTYASNLRLPEDCDGVAVADYDRDGLVDVYAVRGGPRKAGSWLTGKTGGRRGNVLFRNRGNWRFEDVTRQTGTDGGQRSTFTAVWLDADDDGWPDLYVPNEFGNGVLYLNQGRPAGGGPVCFAPRELAPGPCDFGTMGAAAGDVDNDGHIDLYAANMYSKAGSRVIGNLRPGSFPEGVMARMRRFVTGSQLHRNLGGRGFEQRGQAWQVNDCGWAYGPALIDLDNDGWLDLHATAGFISRSRSEPDG